MLINTSFYFVVVLASPKSQAGLWKQLWKCSWRMILLELLWQVVEIFGAV